MIRRAPVLLALLVGLAHLPFVVSSLEDIDSVNFALGVRDFDVADHRPHPPGYPIYIALGKIGTAIVSAFEEDAAQSAREARALSLLALAGAIVAVWLLARVMAVWLAGRDDKEAIGPPWAKGDGTALAATIVAVCCPLFWYLAVRPMSDVPGLAAALAAQSCLLLAWWRQRPTPSGDRRLAPGRMAASGSMIVLGALLSGIATGFRSQNAVLTVPLLLGAIADRVGRGAAGALLGASVAFTAGVLVWAVPLVVASGGPGAYLAALGSQAGEDFAGVEMLSLNPTPRLAAMAVLRTFIHPWDSVALGAIVVALATAGAAVLLVRDRRTLVAIALTAGPYLAFHLLFHDTQFVRYALPLVPPTAVLAIAALGAMGRAAVAAGTLAIAAWSLLIAGPVLAAYAAEPSPTVRAVSAMRAEAVHARPGAIAMHQAFARPLEAEDVSFAPQLPSPPRREWLELARYWREGGLEPIWFLADPRRTDLALIDPQSRRDRRSFDWSFRSLSMLGGMRPAAVDWYRLAAPGWFAEMGWALTPETAGMARLMGQGPSRGPIVAWVRRRSGPVHVLIGGRHLGAASDPPVRFVAALDGRVISEWDASPGFFLRDFDVAPGVLKGEGLARFTVQALSPGTETVPASVEQFDLQSPGTLMWAFGEGWHEAEYAPEEGLWRWTSARAALRVVQASGPVVVTLRIESPVRYFGAAARVQLAAGGELLQEREVAADDLWSVRVPLDALRRGAGRVWIETDRTFVPAERGEGADPRRLGLRVFDVAVADEH